VTSHVIDVAYEYDVGGRRTIATRKTDDDGTNIVATTLARLFNVRDLGLRRSIVMAIYRGFHIYKERASRRRGWGVGKARQWALLVVNRTLPRMYVALTVYRLCILCGNQTQKSFKQLNAYFK